MIKTASEYNYSKAFLDKELELYDYAISERMVSEEINLFFQDTEFYLDLLAEKLRVLEDLADYLEFYSDAKINNAKKYISEKEQVLKGLAGKLTERGAVSVAVYWDTNPLVANTDRDGYELPTAELTRNYCITSSSVLTNEQSPIAITKKSNMQSFSDNIDSCAEAGYYITEYNFDRPKAIEEYLEITIAAPDDFDFLDFIPINCDIEYVGKDHLGHIVLKLSTSNMYKELENFDYDTFKDTNLNSVTALDHRHRQSKSIYEHECDLFKEYDQEQSLHYIDKVKDYWSVNEITGDKKEAQNAVK